MKLYKLKLKFIKNGDKFVKYETLLNSFKFVKICESWKFIQFMYICKTRKIKEYQSVKNCLVGHFSVKNLPRNLLKEAGPPPQMRSGPGYFSCRQNF